MLEIRLVKTSDSDISTYFEDNFSNQDKRSLNQAYTLKPKEIGSWALATATATMSWLGCSRVEVFAPRQNHFEPATLDFTASLTSSNDQECLVKFRSDHVSEQVPLCDIVPIETDTSFWAVKIASLSLPNTFVDLFGDGALCDGFKSSLRESNKQFLASVDQSEDVPISGKSSPYCIRLMYLGMKM